MCLRKYRTIFFCTTLSFMLLDLINEAVCFRKNQGNNFAALTFAYSFACATTSFSPSGCMIFSRVSRFGVV